MSDNRLETALAYAKRRSDEMQSSSSSHLFTSESAKAASDIRWSASDTSEPTATVRLRRSTIEAAKTAWPDKKTRIEAINSAIKSAAESHQKSIQTAPSNSQSPNV